MKPSSSDSGSGIPVVVRQYGRFIVVGGLATLAHIGTFAALMETAAMPALLANTLAFMLAVMISFLGHFSWTYQENTRHLRLRSARAELLRFFVSALIGLALNSLIVWLTTEALQLHYAYALVPMATMVPLLVFLIGRYWVFPATNTERTEPLGEAGR